MNQINKESHFEDYILLKYLVKILLKVIVDLDSDEVSAQISRITQKFEKKHIITRQIVLKNLDFFFNNLRNHMLVNVTEINSKDLEFFGKH